MGDVYPTFKVAAVMAAPVFLDREKTTQKACELIQQAGKQGAELAVFPETYIPGYPFWLFLGSPTWGARFFAELFKNAVEVPSPATEAISEAAAKANIYVVMGINERDHGTLYNTIVYFDRTGKIIGKHRKLQPTHAERTVWGRGDGSDLVVCDMKYCKLGGLICYEHTMDLARYAMVALGEQIHAAIWPPISALTHVPQAPFHNEQVAAMARSHAICGQVFVIATSSVVDDYTVEKLEMKDRPDMLRSGGGWTAIINPLGSYIAGPVTDKEEIVTAEVNLEDFIFAKFFVDSLGHYARPDVLQILVNREKQSIMISSEMHQEPPRPVIEESGAEEKEVE